MEQLKELLLQNNSSTLLGLGVVMEEKDRYELESYNEAFCQIHDTESDEWYLRKDLVKELLNQQDKEIIKLREENQQLKQKLAEERKRVVGELKVDIRSLFNSYASSLIDYCIWNKNADENQKLYNNFKRIINDRLVKVLNLFDKRIDQIERGTYD